MASSLMGKFATLIAATLFVAACSSTDTTSGPTTDGSSVPLTKQEEFAQVVGDRVFFDLDSYTVRPEGMATLQRQAEFLNQNPELTLRVEGHCDERGTREYNLALGERRANAVRDALVSMGIDRSRLSTLSYGKDRPECADASENCWQRNRKGLSVLQGAGS